MSVDIEHQVRGGLAGAPLPPALLLDTGAVVTTVRRRHRRRRTTQAVGAGMGSLALLGALAWSTGGLPAPVRQVLPASPLSCPVHHSAEAHTVEREAIDPAVVPLAGGGTVVAALVQGCPQDLLVVAASADGPADLPDRLAVKGLVEDESPARIGSPRGWRQVVELDGRRLVTVMLPRGAHDLRALTGEGVLPVPGEQVVEIPGTDLAVAVLDGLPDWAGAPAADDGIHGLLVWRDAADRTHVSDGSSLAHEAWLGDAVNLPDRITDTWVGLDTADRYWMMLGGEVVGPLVAEPPFAVAFPGTSPGGAAADAASVELLAVLPGPGGAVETELPGVRLVEQELLETGADTEGVHAARLSLTLPEEASHALVWTAPDGRALPLPLVAPGRDGR